MHLIFPLPSLDPPHYHYYCITIIISPSTHYHFYLIFPLLSLDTCRALSKQAEEEAAAVAAVEAERAEAERVRKLREEYEAAVPDEIKEQVSEAVERELGVLKAAMENKFLQQHSEVLTSLQQFEGKLEGRVPDKNASSPTPS